MRLLPEHRSDYFGYFITVNLIQGAQEKVRVSRILGEHDSEATRTPRENQTAPHRYPYTISPVSARDWPETVELRVVRILFLDESGSPEDPCFAVGGVVVRADQWQELRQKWDAMLEETNWPLDRELKWSGVKRGEVPPDVADQVYDCIQSLPLTCFVTVLRPDEGRALEPALFETPEDTYATALTFLAERFQLHLRQHDSYGVIILDSRRREVDDRMRRFFTRIQREGTPFAELDRIVDGLLLGPSHFSLGLQLADLVTGPTREGQIAMGEGSGRFKDLEPLFARHPDSGELLGVGLKVFPGSVEPV